MATQQERQLMKKIRKKQDFRSALIVSKPVDRTIVINTT